MTVAELKRIVNEIPYAFDGAPVFVKIQNRLWESTCASHDVDVRRVGFSVEVSAKTASALDAEEKLKREGPNWRTMR